MRRLYSLFVLMGALTTSGGSQAARLAVMPVRIDVAADSSFCAVEVGNRGDAPVTVQVRAFVWSQDSEGEEQLTPALLPINPAIFDLPPDVRRLVRCSLPAPQGSSEVSYRLLIDELPREAPPVGTLQTLLRLSLPMFRAPRNTAAALRWVPAGDGLIVLNEGLAHAEVMRTTVYRAGAGTPLARGSGFYLLAGARRHLVAPGSGPIERIEMMLVGGRTIVVPKAAD